jgi:predicted Fe-Mo cluster-binding NifX family protein
MKIAIPTENGVLCEHFGRSGEFTFVEVKDPEAQDLVFSKVNPPEHEPGLLPRWLRSNQIDVVIVIGIGPRAQALLSEYGIEVITGADPLSPEELVRRSCRALSNPARTFVTTSFSQQPKTRVRSARLSCFRFRLDHGARLL